MSGDIVVLREPDALGGTTGPEAGRKTPAPFVEGRGINILIPNID